VDIVVKGRHTDVPERFRLHTVDKLGRIDRFDHKVIRLEVEVSHETNPRLQGQCERIELTCVSRGPVIRAEAAASDPYAALDMAYDKLQMRLRRMADRRRVHHGRKSPVSVAVATAVGGLDSAGAAGVGGGDPAADAELAAGVLPADAIGGIDGDGPLVVREKVHVATPMTLDQALFEMELVGHDFYLFTDLATGQDAVVYGLPEGGYGLRVADGSVPEADAVPLTVVPGPAAEMTEGQAVTQLDLGGDPFVFYVDTGTARGRVLYRRYDGNYGLITPA
jgi:ribosomal subunit interface protein